MKPHEEDFELRLARLKAQTEGVTPRAGFEERVLVLLGATTANDNTMNLVWRWGKFGVAVSALAAAASIVFALNSHLEVEQEEALAYGTTEYFE
jgi:anti-sigma-K factor RskA